MSYALLWLEAPLQAWGADSRFGRRSTLRFPTRSGILGLVCCALGRGGPQEDWLSKWLPLEQIVTAYAKKNYHMPLLCDFHMVGSGYNKDDPWQDRLIPKKNDGTTPSGVSGSKLTYRYYLQDMAFACVLQLPDDAIKEIEAGLSFPAWAICLGRKTCVPADIVFRGIYGTAEEALEAGAKIASEKGLHEKFRVVDGHASQLGQSMVLNDVPRAFGLRKKYQDRYVTVITPAREEPEDDGIDMFASIPET